jgi:NifU-like protein involved in Fe-S cluster formation
MSRFSETLLEHARHPRNCRRDDDADLVGKANLEGGPPQVEFFLRVNDGRIEKASFQAAGCGVTVGACSALVELVEGMMLAEARQVSREQLAKVLEGVPPDKAYCLDVVLAAIRRALAGCGV